MKNPDMDPDIDVRIEKLIVLLKDIMIMDKIKDRVSLKNVNINTNTLYGTF